ncbi:hypothetical protein M2650_00325 [Luteimonas sp. SX5]|uniref:Uncharacterized protein n=1 Tax=Luteimonas galliterrae TaxID=2940486 RepID=A0ABT0ME09_9GAMM|nr:hypothetical protein [Luteimonas galliterrae]MCL1633096.1 hypothetical protein [Luteimonas galliterrae]
MIRLTRSEASRALTPALSRKRERGQSAPASAHSDAYLVDECLMHIVWSGKRDGWLVEKGGL